MLETVETSSRQMSLQLPTPLSDAELLWLSAHNNALTFEQTAGGLLIMTPAAGHAAIVASFGLPRS